MYASLLMTTVADPLSAGLMMMSVRAVRKALYVRLESDCHFSCRSKASFSTAFMYVSRVGSLFFGGFQVLFFLNLQTSQMLTGATYIAKCVPTAEVDLMSTARVLSYLWSRTDLRLVTKCPPPVIVKPNPKHPLQVSQSLFYPQCLLKQRRGPVHN